MKIQLVSDLHLEFEPTFRPMNNGADTLILSGDICVANYFRRSEASPYHARALEFRDFFRHCSSEFEHVIYTPGNHEQYQGYINETDDILREELSSLTNIRYLNQESTIIDGILFFGATMWTDLNKDNPVTEMYLSRGMNDFRLVQWKGKNGLKFRPRDAYNIHTATKEKLLAEIANHDKVVVVSHHAPSHKSIHESYRDDFHMNGGYHSQLEWIMLDNPQIVLWTHGHVHNTFEYMINDCRVICNPRGYNDENPDFNPGSVWEV